MSSHKSSTQTHPDLQMEIFTDKKAFGNLRAMREHRAADVEQAWGSNEGGGAPRWESSRVSQDSRVLGRKSCQ